MAISYTVGFASRKRPFSTEAVGLSYTVEKELFQLNSTFLDLISRLGGSSRKSQPVEKVNLSTFSTGSASRKTQSKRFYACFLNPSHRSSQHQTRAHAHTHIPGTTQQYHEYRSADAGLAITAIASRRKSAWRIPSSALASSIYHTTAAKYRCHFANNGYACCSFGGSRLSATPRT